jgi:hypothetical protein
MMQQKEQEQTDYKPLTEEQKKLLDIIQSQADIELPVWYIFLALPVLGMIMITYGIWDLNLWREYIYLRRWMSLTLLITILSGVFLRSYTKRKHIENNFSNLLPHQDVMITGFLTYATFFTSSKEQKNYIDLLIPLLYRITTKEASRAFTKKQRKQLMDIASKPYWRKNEPDLVAAALVGLVALGDLESKGVLTQLSKQSWSESEKWIGEAAKICLKEWGTR